MSHSDPVRHQLVELLGGESAHAGFEVVIADIPPELRGARPQGVDHSLWQLLEHLRLAQWDILEFSRDPKHVSPTFPDGYWPQQPAPADARQWDATVAACRADLRAMIDRVADPAIDLHEPFQHGTGQTLLREALVFADHNAYHLGQMVSLRRLLGCWPPAGA